MLNIFCSNNIEAAGKMRGRKALAK